MSDIESTQSADDDRPTEGFGEPALRLRQFEDDPRKPEWMIELIAMCIGAHLLPFISGDARVGDVRHAFEQAAIAAAREFDPTHSDGPLRCENCGKPMAEHDRLAQCWGEQSDGSEGGSDG